MRMKDYPKTSTIVKGSTYLNVDSAAAGTKAIESDDLRKQLMGFTTTDEYYDFLDDILSTGVIRSNIYRGKSLGTSFTPEQKARIADGTFKGFFIGDYWTIDDVSYRIADINYWLGSGDPGSYCWIYHLVIIPDTSLGSAKMNDTATTSGGYANSKMRTANMATAVNKINAAFGSDNILEHRVLLTNAVTNGMPSGGLWNNSKVELMNEPMLLGTYMSAAFATQGISAPYSYTIDNKQLSLFRLKKEYMVIAKHDFWLRDIANPQHFCVYLTQGYTVSAAANEALGIRPIFGLKGA